LIMGIEIETNELLLAVRRGDISLADLVRGLEDLECRAPADFACEFTKALTCARHGQISLLVTQLESIVGDPRFATRH
jgi:hypothetical protein